MSEIKVNKLSPRSGTTVTLGDSGDTFAITSGASISGFTSTGIDDNATSTAITIDSSERVGIGESSPISELHITDASATAVVRLESSDSGDCRINFDDQSATDRGRIIYAHSDDSLRTEVAGSERMRIRSNGKIGLNTSSADAELHIAPISGGTNASILLANSNKSQYFRIQNNETDDALVFNANDLNERMRIASSGNVGIGTTSPGARLETKNATDGSTFAFQATNDNDHEIVQIGAQSDGDGYLTVHGQGASTNIKVRLDSDGDSYFTGGNVGIGTSSPEAKLHVHVDNVGTPSTDADDLVIEKTVDTGLSILSTTTGRIFFGDASDNDVGRIMYVHTDNSMRFNTNASEHMRIKSDGGVWVGATSTNPSSATSGNYATINNIFPFQATNNNICQILNRNSSTGVIVEFKYNGSFKGSISTNGSTISYNTSSDHRLKENVVEIENATARLKQLQPKRFNFITDADITVDGFLAHEVSSIVPEAISGTHNEVDDDGNPIYQGIDQSKLVPLLVKTIQELEARITTLENA